MNLSQNRIILSWKNYQKPLNTRWEIENPYNWRKIDSYFWLKSWTEKNNVNYHDLQNVFKLISPGKILCEYGFEFFTSLNPIYGLDIFEDLQLVISCFLLTYPIIEEPFKSQFQPHKRQRSFPKLWQFLLDKLDNHEYNPAIITWLNEEHGIFLIVEPEQLAKLWGVLTKNDIMNYDKMSRTLRYYYKKNILVHHRLSFSYKFCSIKNLRRRFEKLKYFQTNT